MARPDCSTVCGVRDWYRRCEHACRNRGALPPDPGHVDGHHQEEISMPEPGSHSYEVRFTADELRAAADGHELAKGTLVGTFGR